MSRRDLVCTALGTALVLVLASPPRARAATRVENSAGAASSGVTWSGLRDAPARAAADTGDATRVRWNARLADPATATTALRVLASLRAAAGDSADADSCWGALARRQGIWQWEALDRVASRVERREGPAAADSLLAPVDRERWQDGERAAWLDRRAHLRAAAGDSAGAADLARQLVRAYPGVAGTAAQGVALLDSLCAARGDSLPLDVLRMAAEIDVYRGARPRAIADLRRALARSPAADRYAVGLRLAEVLRASRMPLAARAAAESALARAGDTEERTHAQLEVARAMRDAARTDSALALYARVARSGASSSVRATAWWEFAREAEDRGRYRDALEGFTHLAQLGDRRADDARLQAGLMAYALGSPDSARTWWRRAHGEAARFWLGVALRASDRAEGDSLLRALAVLPGYGFYRAAARETLGVRGWTGERVPQAPPGESALAAGADLRLLLDTGREAEAGELLVRLYAGDARSGAVADPGAPAALEAAALAFESGRPSLGTRFAERAFAAAGADSEAWAIVPWAYPLAWSDAVARAAGGGVDAALLWSLARQESRFDPEARSRSDALGLTQLKMAAASDMAQSLGEPRPGERDLLDPGRSLRYGARYLGGLLKRFEGRVPVALAAYNAGPSSVRADWRELIARGGEALYCEMASNADSQDYVKRITGFRQAYRELAPQAAGR